MRQKIVAGNWKMNNDYNQAIDLFSEIIRISAAEHKNDAKLIVACPYISIHALNMLKKKNNSNISIAAQNCHKEESGAYTGEISAKMINSAGADYVILGHSERRQYFKETSEELAAKVEIVLKNNLSPIFCIGETLEQRNVNKYFEAVEQQLVGGLFHLSSSEIKRIILAYEPVWAIGTGLTASPGQAQEMHSFIRKKLNDKYGADTANEISILYGGSCNPKNAPELFSCSDIDGGLIGGASLKAGDFMDIVKTYNN